MARYPIGHQDFAGIRRDGYTYVDKTTYIGKMIEGAKYYFLARPRRFGKSLFVSTLEYFFKGRRDLFKGLAIDSYPWKYGEWDWAEYPVIRIDLAPANYTVPGGVEQRIDAVLGRYERQYGVSSTKEDPVDKRFENLIISICEQARRQVVVLVDEYEKPVIDVLDKSELMEENRECLRAFYSVLKASDQYLKFVFLTGVTKFGQMSVFSGLNNLRDISLDREYGAICGITTDELLFNFKEGIEAIALEEETDFEGAVEVLKYNYDGYHFCINCPDIYNPFSLINAFASAFIGAYWSYTGTPTLLANLLRNRNYNIPSLNGVKANQEQLFGLNNQFDDPVALFYQTGYLTIKGYDKESRKYIMGYPNYEVEKSFFDFLLPSFSGRNIMDTESFMDQLKTAVKEGYPEQAMSVLEEFTAGLSYDTVPAPEVERHFQNIIYITSRLLISRNVSVHVEQKTSAGRIDMLIETPDYVYVMEFKRDSSPEEAIRQIEEKGYALSFRSNSRKVYLIGVNFSTAHKRIDAWKIQEGN